MTGFVNILKEHLFGMGEGEVAKLFVVQLDPFEMFQRLLQVHNSLIYLTNDSIGILFNILGIQ